MYRDLRAVPVRGQAHTGHIDKLTIAKMEIALERACCLFPTGTRHSARRRIATAIIACANHGEANLTRLTICRFSTHDPAGTGLDDLT